MLLIWYPKCSTCRKAKAWLDAHGLSCDLRDIKAQPPTAAELTVWQKVSGLPLRRWFNTSGQVYRAVDLKNRLDGMEEEKQLELLASDGMLVKRPVLVAEDRVLVGFREADWSGLLP